MKKLPIHLLAVLGLCGNVWAQTPGPAHDLAALKTQLVQFLRAESGLAEDAPIRVAALEPTLTLAHCPAPVFSLPNSAAPLRGSIRVGVRCSAPQVWNLYVSAVIQDKPAAASAKPRPSRAITLVKAGQTVTLLAGGPGFKISHEGRALANASDGQSVQVRTPSGQVVTGQATPEGIVVLTP